MGDTVCAAAIAVDDPRVMHTSASPITPQAFEPGGDLTRPMRLAGLGFALFVAGAATTMTIAGLFSPLLLLLAALINVVAMLSICAATAAVLDLGGRHPEDGPTRRTRILRRTFNLAALYWTAAGLAFLLSPFLAQL